MLHKSWKLLIPKKEWFDLCSKVESSTDSQNRERNSNQAEGWVCRNFPQCTVTSPHQPLFRRGHQHKSLASFRSPSLQISRGQQAIQRVVLKRAFEVSPSGNALARLSSPKPASTRPMTASNYQAHESSSHGYSRWHARRQKSVSLVLVDVSGYFWIYEKTFRRYCHTRAFTKLQIASCWSREPTTETGCNPS